MAENKDLLLNDEEDYDDYKDRYQGDREDKSVSTRLMVALFAVCVLVLVIPFSLHVFGVITRGVMSLCFIPAVLITLGILIAYRK